MTSSSGALACTALFDAFGNAQGAASAKNPCNSGGTFDTYFYRGGRVDGTTGDYQFGSRVYDPSKGVFTTPDSYRRGDPGANVGLATDPLMANGFAYAAGDPVNFWDPTGHNPCSSEATTRAALRAARSPRTPPGLRAHGLASHLRRANPTTPPRTGQWHSTTPSSRRVPMSHPRCRRQID